jgi:hypothetical protein
MKRLLSFCVLLLMAVAMLAADTLKEGFESGMPTSAPSSETVVTLASG